MSLELWRNVIAAAFHVVAACSWDRWFFVVLIRVMMRLLVLGGKQTKVWEPFIEKHGCRSLRLLVLFPWRPTEAHIEELWSNVKLGGHGKIAIAHLLWRIAM